MNPPTHIQDPAALHGLFRARRRRMNYAFLAVILIGGLFMLSLKSGSELGMSSEFLSRVSLAAWAIFFVVFVLNSRCPACETFRFWFIERIPCPRCGVRGE
jgi:hypothetical protein